MMLISAHEDLLLVRGLREDQFQTLDSCFSDMAADSFFNCLRAPEFCNAFFLSLFLIVFFKIIYFVLIICHSISFLFLTRVLLFLPFINPFKIFLSLSLFSNQFFSRSHFSNRLVYDSFLILTSDCLTVFPLKFDYTK